MSELTAPALRAIDESMKSVRGQRIDLDREERRLKRAREALVDHRSKRAVRRKTARKATRARTRKATSLTPEQMAKTVGPKNMERVESALANLAPTTQAELGRALDINSGTLSYALRALGGSGKASPTGRRIGNSPEWRYTGEQVAAPGSEAVGA